MKIKKFTYLFAIMAMFAFTFSPALAFNGQDNYYDHDGAWLDYSAFVMNTNFAMVNNKVETKANTGENEAEGGNGGHAGQGGDIVESEDDNIGGNGGNGGPGGDGGQVLSGDATALTTVSNEVNDILTEVDDACGCVLPEVDYDNDLDGLRIRKFLDRSARVINYNNGILGNDVETKAETGDNEVDGGNGGQAGDSGDVTASEDDNTSGNGGHGAAGGWGGLISSGTSMSDTILLNIVNRVVTRIRN